MRRTIGLILCSVSIAAVAAACGNQSGTVGGSAGTTTTRAAPATTALNLRGVTWKDVTVPAAVCPHATEPVHLSGGHATIPAPAGLDAGTSRVVISEGGVAYGDLYGNGRVVATLNVWCENAGGTADGQLQDSWVVYSGRTGTLAVLATLTPQHASSPGSHVAYFDTTPGGLEIGKGKITAKEVFYGQTDATCCPSGRATTVWTLTDGSLSPATSVQSSAGGS